MWTFGSGLLLCQSFRRRREETAWKWRRIGTSLVIVIFMVPACVDVRCFLETVMEWNWCCAICILRGLIWRRVWRLTLFPLLFGTNCVVVITEYWSSNHLQH
jgi:hypothetical protein